MRGGGRGYLAAWAAGLAFAGLVVAFGFSVFAFRANVERWARRDLVSQAELAAEGLREPLATQDFRRLREISDHLAAKEMILRVRSDRGGWIFHGGYKGPTIEEYVPCGDCRVGVALREGRVMKPFYDAFAVFVLAVLVGVCAMGVVFFTLYRQRVRIRELKRLEKFRRDFIADFSHELKTPLTGILGAVEMLDAASGAAADGSDRLLLGLIGKEAKRLDALAGEMLDLAKLERAAETELRRGPVDLAAVLEEVRARFQAEAEEKGVTLAVAPVEGTASVVAADRDLLFRALSNLVANAIRHSGGRRVDVSACVAAREARFVVADDGCGVPEGERKRIFERFARIESSRTTPGTGLGLPIARSIARLHGGELVYEPAVPHGARFVLTVFLV